MLAVPSTQINRSSYVGQLSFYINKGVYSPTIMYQHPKLASVVVVELVDAEVIDCG